LTLAALLAASRERLTTEDADTITPQTIITDATK
jgi:hypothetical protein